MSDQKNMADPNWPIHKINELIIPQAGKIRFIREVVSDWAINPEMLADWTHRTMEEGLMGLVHILDGITEDLENIPARFSDALKEKETGCNE